jgi:copper chaperone
MKTKKFKTNIMCGSCIAKVTPVLNETFGENNWEVDIKNPNKILTVSLDNVYESEVKESLERMGYKAEELAG